MSTSKKTYGFRLAKKTDASEAQSPPPVCFPHQNEPCLMLEVASFHTTNPLLNIPQTESMESGPFANGGPSHGPSLSRLVKRRLFNGCPADVQPLDVVNPITNKIPEFTRNRWQKSYNTGGRLYDLYVFFFYWLYHINYCTLIYIYTYI